MKWLVVNVGIVTHHNIKNFGAYLQAYALLKTIEGLGHEVVTIDLVNLRHVLSNYRPFFIRKPRVANYTVNGLKCYFDGYRQFAKLSRSLNHLRLTRPVFSAKQINSLGLDAIVVGSDEVWNFVDVGYHPVKFGIGIEVPILVSYAAGTGAVMPNDVPPSGVKEGLTRFSGLSVREYNGVQFIRKLLGITPRVVLDPTLIYDFNSEETPSPIVDKEYILVYHCRLEREYQELVRDYAKNNGFAIVGAGCADLWFDMSLIDIDPFSWIGLFMKRR